MTDADLIAGIKSRQRDAFNRLYDRYAQIIFSLCIRILRDKAEAEDVMQEIFVQIWRDAERFDAARASVKTWMFTIARSRALDRYRSRKTAQKRVDHATPEDRIAQLSDSSDMQTTTLMQQYVGNALRQLTPEQRMVLEMSYYEGLTQEEIAERLKQPLGTVKSRIRASLMKLRSLFAGEAQSDV